jgi:hypothetical protein
MACTMKSLRSDDHTRRCQQPQPSKRFGLQVVRSNDILSKIIAFELRQRISRCCICTQSALFEAGV